MLHREFVVTDIVNNLCYIFRQFRNEYMPIKVHAFKIIQPTSLKKHGQLPWDASIPYFPLC